MNESFLPAHVDRESALFRSNESRKGFSLASTRHGSLNHIVFVIGIAYYTILIIFGTLGNILSLLVIRGVGCHQSPRRKRLRLVQQSLSERRAVVIRVSTPCSHAEVIDPSRFDQSNQGRFCCHNNEELETYDLQPSTKPDEYGSLEVEAVEGRTKHLEETNKPAYSGGAQEVGQGNEAGVNELDENHMKYQYSDGQEMLDVEMEGSKSEENDDCMARMAPERKEQGLHLLLVENLPKEEEEEEEEEEEVLTEVKSSQKMSPNKITFGPQLSSPNADWPSRGRNAARRANWPNILCRKSSNSNRPISSLTRSSFELGSIMCESFRVVPSNRRHGSKGRKHPSRGIFTALALADTLVLWVNPLRYWILFVFNYDIRTDSGVFMCRLQTFCSYACRDIAIWVLCLLTMERFLSACLPHRASLIWRGRKKQMVWIGLFVLLLAKNSVLLSILEIFQPPGALNSTSTRPGTSEGKPICDTKDKGLRRAFFYIDIVEYSLIPSIILLFLNLALLRVLHKARHIRNQYLWSKMEVSPTSCPIGARCSNSFVCLGSEGQTQRRSARSIRRLKRLQSSFRMPLASEARAHGNGHPSRLTSALASAQMPTPAPGPEGLPAVSASTIAASPANALDRSAYQANRLLVPVSLFHLVASVPLCIFSIIEDAGNLKQTADPEQHELVFSCGRLLAMLGTTNHGANCLIYFLSSRSFRRRLILLLKQPFLSDSGLPDSTTTNPAHSEAAQTRRAARGLASSTRLLVATTPVAAGPSGLQRNNTITLPPPPHPLAAAAVALSSSPSSPRERLRAGDYAHKSFFLVRRQFQLTKAPLPYVSRRIIDTESTPKACSYNAQTATHLSVQKSHDGFKSECEAENMAKSELAIRKCIQQSKISLILDEYMKKPQRRKDAERVHCKSRTLT